MAEGATALTHRELELLQLMADGKSTPAIAAALGPEPVQPNRIKKMRTRIKGKLGLDKGAGIPELLERARELDLIN
jgi:DNA-binding CsgD family transcriptional regulator